MIEVRALATKDPLSLPIFQRELLRRYLISDPCVGGQRRVDLHPLVLTPRLHRAAVTAAETVYAGVSQVAARAHDDAAERARYGLHPDVLRLAAASHKAGDHASLVRVDLLIAEDGTFQACAINADCPGGHNEALGLPALAQAAGFWDGVDPTRTMPMLVERLVAMARPAPPLGRSPLGRHLAARLPGAVGLLYSTDCTRAAAGAGGSGDQRQICALIGRALRARGVRAVIAPHTALRLRHGRLCVGDEPLAALYRPFPTACMKGQDNLGDLEEAVAGGQVRTLSSFAGIFTQSKLSLARTWSLSRGAARAYLPETHVLPLAPSPGDQALPGEQPPSPSLAQLRAERASWVLKRALGNGAHASAHIGASLDDAAWHALLDSRPDGTPDSAIDDLWIVQRFVPQRPVPTPLGPRLLTLGVYLLDGQFCGYFARMTPPSPVASVAPIVHDALCLPVFVGLRDRNAREIRPLQTPPSPLASLPLSPIQPMHPIQ